MNNSDPKHAAARPITGRFVISLALLTVLMLSWVTLTLQGEAPPAALSQAIVAAAGAVVAARAAS